MTRYKPEALWRQRCRERSARGLAATAKARMRPVASTLPSVLHDPIAVDTLLARVRCIADWHELTLLLAGRVSDKDRR